MTGDELFKLLSDNQQWGRWGANNQPSIYLVTAILEQLPVKYIAGGHDRLQVAFSRELTVLEYWTLDRLTPDSIQRDGNDIDMWWD